MSDLRETTFTWAVRNFDVAPHRTGERLESPGFSPDVMKKSKFSLLLYPRGAKDGNYVSLFVKRHRDNAAKHLCLRYELCVIDADGKCANAQMSSTTEFREGLIKGYAQFYERHLLLGSLRRVLLPENTLTVRCRLLPIKDEDSCGSEYSLADSDVLSKDFAELLESGIHSDLTIEAQGKEFRVHKAILEARCPRLIAHLVKTEESDGMALPSTEASVLQGVLHYVYTGILKDIGKLEEMFAAANSYEIANLKTLLYPYPDCINAETVKECFRISFRWIISDFESFQQSNKETSYIMIADDIPESCWMKITLFAKQCDDGRKSTHLKFQKIRNYYTGAVQFKIQACDKHDELILLKDSENVFENGEFVTPFDAECNSAKTLVDGNLKLRFDIRASINYGRSSIREITFGDVQTPIHDVIRNWESLQEEMLLFYKNMKTGDVTLNVGAQKLTAHKAVLCSRSEVFSKMFQHDSLESRTNSVDIKDVDEETMTSVLMYMYCGMTDDVMHVLKAIRIYSAADKYQLLLLKEKCCQYLKSNINAENVGDVLLLADAHSDGVLKECVHSFITGNASEVLHSQRGLKVLGNRVDLYQDILNVLLRCVSLQNNVSGTGKK